MSFLRQIESLLHENHAELVRSKKHRVYRFPDGRNWVVAGSPRSDSSWKTNLHDLRKFLGHDLSANTNPHRKVKQGTKRVVRFEELASVKVPAWVSQLKAFVEANPQRPSLKCPEPPPCVPSYQVTPIYKSPVSVLLGKVLR